MASQAAMEPMELVGAMDRVAIMMAAVVAMVVLERAAAVGQQEEGEDEEATEIIEGVEEAQVVGLWGLRVDRAVPQGQTTAGLVAVTPIRAVAPANRARAAQAISSVEALGALDNRALEERARVNWMGSTGLAMWGRMALMEYMAAAEVVGAVVLAMTAA